MVASTAQTSEGGPSRLQISMQQLIDWEAEAGRCVMGTILTFVVGRFLVSLIKKLSSKLLMKRYIGAGIQSSIESLVNTPLAVLLVITIIDKLGVETTPFATLLASAGVAAGMVSSRNLQNFAGGLIVLLFRPLKTGGWIEGQGVSGTVCEIQIFHTILTTADNRVTYIPSGTPSSDTVTNYSREGARCVDWVIGVKYGENYDKVESIVRRIFAADDRIPNTPEPFVAPHALDASSVDIVIHVWARNSDYWGVYFGMNKTIYATFGKEGVGFPLPQLTVYQAKD